MMSVDDAVRAAIETEGTAGDDARAELGGPRSSTPTPTRPKTPRKYPPRRRPPRKRPPRPTRMRLRTRARTRTPGGDADAEEASSDDEEEEEPEEGQLGARTLSQILAAEIAERFDDGFVVDGLRARTPPRRRSPGRLSARFGSKTADALPEEPLEDAPEDWQPAKEAEGAFALRG